MSLFPYHRPVDPAVGELVAPRIAQMQDAGTPIRAVMLDRLGSNVWHGSPAEASSVLEELEETARLWPLTRAASLDPKQIDELRRQVNGKLALRPCFVGTRSEMAQADDLVEDVLRT